MHTQLHRSTKETPVVLYTMRPQLLQYRSAARNSRVNLRWKNSWSVGFVCVCRGQCRCRCFACACAGVGARRLVLGTGLSAGFNSKILHSHTDTHAHLMYACMYACSSHRHHSPDQVVIPPDVCTPDQVCPKHICNVCVCIYTCVCVCVCTDTHTDMMYTHLGRFRPAGR